MFASSSVGQLTHNSSLMSASIWILDYGASHHMSPNFCFFVFMSHSSSIIVMTVVGTLMPLAGVGFVVTPNISLSNVYYILKLKLNLVAVGQLCDYGDLVTFSSCYCFVQDL